jgi:hypothetical protein
MDAWLAAPSFFVWISMIMMVNNTKKIAVRLMFLSRDHSWRSQWGLAKA